MEDRVQIASELLRLLGRRGFVHRGIEELQAKENIGQGVRENLGNLGLITNCFYTFNQRVYDWYIGKLEDFQATHFWLPLKGNPMLWAAVDTQREEKEEQSRREVVETLRKDSEAVATLEAWGRGIDDFEYDREKWRYEQTTGQFLSWEFLKEMEFYFGWVASEALWAHCMGRHNKDFSQLGEELYLEVNHILPYHDSRARYAQAILER